LVFLIHNKFPTLSNTFFKLNKIAINVDSRSACNDKVGLLFIPGTASCKKESDGYLACNRKPATEHQYKDLIASPFFSLIFIPNFELPFHMKFEILTVVSFFCYVTP